MQLFLKLPSLIMYILPPLTGDRAIRDKDGYFYFVGRSDDVILSAGLVAKILFISIPNTKS